MEVFESLISAGIEPEGRQQEPITDGPTCAGLKDLAMRLNVGNPTTKRAVLYVSTRRLGRDRNEMLTKLRCLTVHRWEIAADVAAAYQCANVSAGSYM
jgi:hypothetical protein